MIVAYKEAVQIRLLMHTPDPEIGEFAKGIVRDRAAVEAALRLRWSNGQTEAQVLQLKTLRRQMHGGGGFSLVRRRVVKAACTA
jgi:transposase